VRPPGRFGALKLTKDSFVSQFQEKPNGDGSWINGGYFVLSPKVVKDISGDQTIWEDQPLKNIAANGQLVAYKHEGFWQPMDTLREKNLLNALWDNNKASWKVW
jgi:glucose-1-phosphate cytidylyltransferase